MKIFQREQRSLFGEILDWMLTPLLLLWPASLALTWLVAQNIAGKPFDRALAYNVQALAQLVTVRPAEEASADGKSPAPRVHFNLPQSARELLRSGDADQVYYQVLGAKAELLSGERDMPMPPEDSKDATKLATDQVLLRDDEMRGLDVRVAWMWVTLDADDAGHARPVLIQVAETREKRSVLATEIIKGVMLPQFVILPLAVLLVWLALVRGIKPLSQLEDRIRARRSDDLSPLDESAVPLEVAPLVTSVNGLLMRLNDSIATQKRFLADAAHQLKTPLAGLAVQAALAQRKDTSNEELKHSLSQIGLASVRATHSVNQLLALARAESNGPNMPREKCDLAQITMAVVQQCLPRALEKRLDLGYEGAQPGALGVTLQGNQTLLQEMIRNLLDNAIHYTPSTDAQPGIITARVLADPFGKAPVLQIEDSGPGIPNIEKKRIFEPFYRALGTGVDGTGLGLPIVLEIAQQHGAIVSVEDVHSGHVASGARFVVRFAKT